MQLYTKDINGKTKCSTFTKHFVLPFIIPLTRDELAVYYYNRTISTTIKVIIPGNNIVATTSSQSNFPPHSLSL